MKPLVAIAFAAFALAPVPGAAQGPALVPGAVAAGEVGERYDGYMGFVTTPSPSLQRQVAAINLRRRNLYIDLAERRNVTAELVGMATACQLFGQLPAGGAYMLQDGVWRHRRGGQPVPLPDYCR